MKLTRLLAALLPLSFCVSAAWGQSEPLDALIRSGCGGRTGEPLSKDERRFFHLYNQVISDALNVVYDSPGGKGVLVPDANVLKKLLRAKFDNRNLSCKLSLESDGSITDLKIFRTSGSTPVDDLALNTIRKAAPFAGDNSARSQTYLVDFPTMHVQQIK